MATGDELRTLMAGDIGASGEYGVVPTSREINGKPLTADVDLDAEDVGAVPDSREINGNPLSADVTLTAADVGAAPDTREINGNPLSADVTLDAGDIGYDNSNSGLSADDLQEAIDELASEKADASDIPAPSSEMPLMDGTADVGESNTYARGDHIHPSDISRAPAIVESISGGVVSFEDGAAEAVKSLVVEIPALQKPGTPTPENPFVLRKWTSIPIMQSRRNLIVLNDVTEYDISTNGYLKGKIEGGTIKLRCTGNVGRNDGTTIINNSHVSSQYNAYPPGTYSVRVKNFKRTGNAPNNALSSDKIAIRTLEYGSSAGVNRSNNTVFVATRPFYVYSITQLGYTEYANGEIISFDIMLELADAPNGWEAFEGSRTAIAIPDAAGTVCAGRLDVINGKLYAKPYYASYNGETLVGPWLSSMDVYSEGVTPTTGAEVVDLGGTEAEYDIDSTEIKTLPGVNYLWAGYAYIDDLQYRADTKLYTDAVAASIRASIAPTEDGVTASQAYAQGKYFFRNGDFCKAITAIASGAAFTLDTNYSVTTVAAELFAALNP